MPIIIKDVQDGLGVIITGSGVVTDEDYLNEFRKHLTQDKEKIAKYRYTLGDYSAATEVNVTYDAIQEVSEMCLGVSKIVPEQLVALVASRDLTYGLIRMADSLMYGTGWEQKVFRDRQEAEDWIKKRAREKYGIADITFDEHCRR